MGIEFRRRFCGKAVWARMQQRIWRISPGPSLNAAETQRQLTNLPLKKSARATDKIAADEDGNKILKHQGTILRKGDNGGRARVKRIFFKETLGEDGWTKGGEEMKRGSREWEMGGRERAGHSFPSSPWFSVRVAQEDKAKRSVSLLWNNPFCVSPLSISLSFSRRGLSLCLMAQLRFRAIPFVIRLISGGLLTSPAQ